ncbi:hypothetical protein EAO30_15790 [Klebsiella pneumoniae]|nr:hypothetical protein EAO30_15790 [Klebsiella pneumoniae]
MHSNALTTILPETKGLFRNYHTAFRKQNNTETEVTEYTNTTICARHHSGKSGPLRPNFRWLCFQAGTAVKQQPDG